MKCNKKYILFILPILAIMPLMLPAEIDIHNQEDVLPIVAVFEFERQGDFLKNPSENEVEVLRRLGRSLNNFWSETKEVVRAASILKPAQIGTPDFLFPIREDRLNQKQRDYMNSILDEYKESASNMLKDFDSYDSTGLQIVFAGEGSVIYNAFAKLDSRKSEHATHEQVSNMQLQAMPFFEDAKYVIGAAVLSEKGFEAKISLKAQLSDEKQIATPHGLSIGKYLNPESLMFFAQTHQLPEAEVAMDKLKKMPQTNAVLSMVESAGLDFKNDLLANTARESIVYVNLGPDVKTGLPDIRFVLPVPDIKKLRGNFEGLKNLAMQTGVFMHEKEDNLHNFIQLSYFMFPQYSLFAGLVEEVLIISMSDKSLIEEMDHIVKIKSQQLEYIDKTEGYQRYWRISFADFNRQLQIFLQSPLLRNQGIPPIPNLTMLDDLGDFILKARVKPEGIDFFVAIPIE